MQQHRFYICIRAEQPGFCPRLLSCKVLLHGVISGIFSLDFLCNSRFFFLFREVFLSGDTTLMKPGSPVSVDCITACVCVCPCFAFINYFLP